MVAGMMMSLLSGWSGIQAPARLQRALRLQHDGAVDHSAVELGGARRRGFGGEHASRPVERLRDSVSSAAWIGATWRGWMHSLAPKPWRRDHARSAQQARLRRRVCGVTPRHRRPTGPRHAMRSRVTLAAWARPSVSVGDVEVEVERVVERAEDQARDAVGAVATCCTFATPHALSIRASTRGVRHEPLVTAATCAARLGLGQHHALRCARRAAVAGRRRRPLDCASLMRTTMRARSASLACSRPARDRVARLALGLQARRRPRGPARRASAPLASALAKRSGRLPGTNR